MSLGGAWVGARPAQAVGFEAQLARGGASCDPGFLLLWKQERTSFFPKKFCLQETKLYPGIRDKKG